MNYLRTVFRVTPCEEWAIECIAALAEEVGYEGFEYTEFGLIGYIPEELFQEDRPQQVAEGLPNDNIHIEHTTTPLPDINWNTTWENAGFEPITIDGQCIVIDERHPIAPEQTAQYPIRITIRATQSFGTGTHATTQLMLRQLMGIDLHRQMVVDCGCGTGILAIAAAMKGANHVIAFDIDHWSTECTQYNAEANHAELDIRLGDISVVKDITHTADIVLANINRNILLTDMPHYARLCKEEGTVLLSGILIDDAPVVLRRAEEEGLTLIRRYEHEGWLLLHLRKQKNTTHQ